MRNFYVISRKALILSIVTITILSIIVCSFLYQPLTELANFLNEKLITKDISWLAKIGYVFHPFSFATVFSVLWFLYNKFVWKFFAHFGLLTNLNGTWCGHIVSSYGSGKKLYCITIIKQSFCTIYIKSRFYQEKDCQKESSYSDGFNFNISDVNCKKYISFSYTNTKRENISPDMEHPGFNYFYLDQNRLDGQYSTFRNVKTFGDIKLSKINKKTNFSNDILNNDIFNSL